MRRHGAEVRACGCDPEGLAVVAAWGPDRIAVAGGDGTIGDCAELAGRLGVPLAVIPLGTANDFARTADLPLEVEAACVLAVTGSALRPLELGRLADGRPFVNVASAGLASAAARCGAPFKRLGPLAPPLPRPLQAPRPARLPRWRGPRRAHRAAAPLRGARGRPRGVRGPGVAGD